MIVENKLGGIDETDKHLIERAKKADLLTFPKDISGTNCYNCKFISNKTKEKGFCTHPKVKQLVNGRMCCAFWDNSGAIRSYGEVDATKYR